MHVITIFPSPEDLSGRGLDSLPVYRPSVTSLDCLGHWCLWSSRSLTCCCRFALGHICFGLFDEPSSVPSGWQSFALSGTEAQNALPFSSSSLPSGRTIRTPVLTDSLSSRQWPGMPSCKQAEASQSIFEQGCPLCMAFQNLT